MPKSDTINRTKPAIASERKLALSRRRLLPGNWICARRGLRAGASWDLNELARGAGGTRGRAWSPRVWVRQTGGFFVGDRGDEATEKDEGVPMT